jgi:hypothetical protein
MNITSLIKKGMKEGIDKVLSGKKKEFEGKHITGKMVQLYMISLGYTEWDRDHNGLDMWLRFSKGNGKTVYVAYFGFWDGTFIFGTDD